MKKHRPVHANAALDISPLTGTPTLTAANISHARGLLREVGSLAGLALSMSRKPLPADQGAEDLQSRVSVLQRLLDRIGWLADVGLRELGEPGSLARAEDWMLAEVRVSALSQASAFSPASAISGASAASAA